jgi:hypothetical protein
MQSGNQKLLIEEGQTIQYIFKNNIILNKGNNKITELRTI